MVNGRHTITRLFFVIMLSTLKLGCYEGWEDDGLDGPAEPPEPVPETKPIYYILYQPIYLSVGAIGDDDCFPKEGVREYRQNEWALRNGENIKALKAITEKFVQKDIQVAVDDCDTLEIVRSNAIDSEPWGSEPPGTDQLGRRTVHLKAVFYDGEPILTPPSVVTSPDWRAFDDLIFAGQNAESRHYFVLANPEDGYFTEWRQSLLDGGASVTDGSAINDVDPTPDGIDNRNSTIKSDAGGLANWILKAPVKVE